MCYMIYFAFYIRHTSYLFGTAIENRFNIKFAIVKNYSSTSMSSLLLFMQMLINNWNFRKIELVNFTLEKILDGFVSYTIGFKLGNNELAGVNY